MTRLVPARDVWKPCIGDPTQRTVPNQSANCQRCGQDRNHVASGNLGTDEHESEASVGHKFFVGVGKKLLERKE